MKQEKQREYQKEIYTANPLSDFGIIGSDEAYHKGIEIGIHGLVRILQDENVVITKDTAQVLEGIKKDIFAKKNPVKGFGLWDEALLAAVLVIEKQLINNQAQT